MLALSVVSARSSILSTAARMPPIAEAYHNRCVASRSHYVYALRGCSQAKFGCRMPFVLGWNALFGRTDKVPGLFFVGTSFFYFCFIPLIPLGSYIVRYQDDDWFGGFRGVSIGISVKSVVFAWLRAATVIFIIYIIARFIGQYVAPIFSMGWRIDLGWGFDFAWQDFAAIAGGCAFLWLLSVASIASSARAAELARLAGYDPKRT